MGQTNGFMCDYNNPGDRRAELQFQKQQLLENQNQINSDYNIIGKQRQIIVMKAGMVLVQKSTEAIISLIHQFDPTNYLLEDIIQQREQKHYTTAKEMLITLLYNILADNQLRQLFFKHVNDPDIVVYYDENDKDRVSDVSAISHLQETSTPKGKKQYKFPYNAQVRVQNSNNTYNRNSNISGYTTANDQNTDMFSVHRTQINQSNIFRDSSQSPNRKSNHYDGFRTSPLRERLSNSHLKTQSQNQQDQQNSARFNEINENQDQQYKQWKTTNQNQIKNVENKNEEFYSLNNQNQYQKNQYESDSTQKLPYQPQVPKFTQGSSQQKSNSDKINQHSIQQTIKQTSEFSVNQTTNLSKQNDLPIIRDSNYKLQQINTNGSSDIQALKDQLQYIEAHKQMQSNHQTIYNKSDTVQQQHQDVQNQNLQMHTHQQLQQEQEEEQKQMNQNYEQQQNNFQQYQNYNNQQDNNTNYISKRSQNSQSPARHQRPSQNKLESNVKLNPMQQLDRSFQSTNEKVIKQTVHVIQEEQPQYQITLPVQQTYIPPNPMPKETEPIKIYDQVKPQVNDLKLTSLKNTNQLYMHSERSLQGKQEQVINFKIVDTSRSNYVQETEPPKSDPQPEPPQPKPQVNIKFKEISDLLKFKGNMLHAINRTEHPYLEKLEHRPFVEIWRYYDKNLNEIVYVKKYNQLMGIHSLINFQIELTILKSLQEYQMDKQQMCTQITSVHPEQLILKYRGGLCSLQEYALELYQLGKQFSESQLLYICMQLCFYVFDMEEDYQLFHGDIKPQCITLVHTQFSQDQYELRLVEFESCVQTDQEENYPVYSTTNYCDKDLKYNKETNSVIHSELYNIAKTVMNLNNFSSKKARLNEPEQVENYVNHLKENTYYLGDILEALLKVQTQDDMDQLINYLNNLLDSSDWKIEKLDYIKDEYNIIKSIKQKRLNMEKLCCERQFEDINKDLFIQEVHFCVETQNFERGNLFLTQILTFNGIIDNMEKRVKLGFYKKVFVLAKKIFQDDESYSRFVMECTENYGNCLIEYEFYKDALIMHQICLKDKINFFKGKTNLPVSNSYMCIGKLFEKIQQPEKALINYKQCLGIRLHIYQSTPHTSIARALYHIGQIYYNNNIIDQATRHSKLAYQMMKKIFDEDDEDNPDQIEGTNYMATYLHLWAFCIQASGNYDLGLKQHFLAQEIVSQNNHENNSNMVLTSIFKIGEAYFKIKDYDQALRYYEKAEQLGTDKYVNSLPLEIMPYILEAIGNIYILKNQYQNALGYFNKSFHRRQKLFGDKSLRLSLVWEKLALVYFKLNKFKQALTCQQEYLKIQKKLSFNSLKSKNAYNFLITIEDQVNKEQNQKLSNLKSQIKVNSTDQAKTLFNQAIAFKEQECFEEALECLNQSKFMLQKMNALSPRKIQAYQNEEKDIEQRQNQMEKLKLQIEEKGLKQIYKPTKLPSRSPSHSPKKKLEMFLSKANQKEPQEHMQILNQSVYKSQKPKDINIPIYDTNKSQNLLGSEKQNPQIFISQQGQQQQQFKQQLQQQNNNIQQSQNQNQLKNQEYFAQLQKKQQQQQIQQQNNQNPQNQSINNSQKQNKNTVDRQKVKQLMEQKKQQQKDNNNNNINQSQNQNFLQKPKQPFDDQDPNNYVKTNTASFNK